MKNKLFNGKLLFTTMLYLTCLHFTTKCFAQGTEKAGFQIEVKEVSVLPHIDARYKTMKLLPSADYQNWGMDRGSRVEQVVVEVPVQQDSIWIEALVLIKNDSTDDAKFNFKTPTLELNGGKSIEAWEHLFAGMADYDGLVRVLGLSDKAPDKNTIHLNVEGTLYCNLKSKQQTWMILLFQVPKNAKEGKLTINNYPTSTLKIPMSNK